MIQTFTDARGNIVTAEMSIKDYLHKKGLYLSRTYFAMHSRNGVLLDLVLLNSFQRKILNPILYSISPPTWSQDHEKNTVAQSQEESKDQCNRSVLSDDINFNFDEDVHGAKIWESETRLNLPEIKIQRSKMCAHHFRLYR